MAELVLMVGYAIALAFIVLAQEVVARGARQGALETSTAEVVRHITIPVTAGQSAGTVNNGRRIA